MVGRRYHSFMEGLFDFILILLLYGRLFDLHRNGIYATSYFVGGEQ